MRASLAQVAAKPRDGAFAAACFDHTGGLGVGGGTSIALNGTARRLRSGEALAAWFFRNDTRKLVEAEALPFDALGRPANPSCRHLLREPVVVESNQKIQRS